MVVEVQNDRIPLWKQEIALGIIILNVIVFILQYLDPAGNMLLDGFAFTPSEFFAGKEWWTLFTSMFMHANPIHIIFNLWFFYVVADNCEFAMGHTWFLATYLVSGILGTLLHGFTAFIIGWQDIPTLGASGAIYGLIAVYAILFPKIKLQIVTRRVPYQITARKFAILYFVTEIIYGVISFTAVSDGTAHFAHIGGFIGGVIFALAFKYLKKGKAEGQ
jgi:membrane associated rhomboid family serine protease